MEKTITRKLLIVAWISRPWSWRCRSWLGVFFRAANPSTEPPGRHFSMWPRPTTTSLIAQMKQLTLTSPRLYLRMSSSKSHPVVVVSANQEALLIMNHPCKFLIHLS